MESGRSSYQKNIEMQARPDGYGQKVTAGEKLLRSTALNTGVFGEIVLFLPSIAAASKAIGGKNAQTPPRRRFSIFFFNETARQIASISLFHRRKINPSENRLRKSA
jgi:hypothetical protein